MREAHLCTALRREILFIAACAAAAVLCVGLAFWFAVPQQPSQKQLPPDSTPLSEHGPFARVADAAAVPGLTEDLVASWEGQATVNTPAQTMP